ncbi:aminoacyl-tRNA hydrolase [Pseudidiomarina gelatinasegens]|jgi:ribosome-associated protein|uniref:Aminoacyl-tRNA hydrolase n=1 Tax=Pseudidiomarina gelatinasegens TaxID=2487740 RepID=A0A443YYJ9_9GAMM|nr:alternative ribosome rescue aminoacyl-tRNA hydrolase ArfB [Pseudidiomarina gelatinasegens]RWU09192.1 aminoacyl-tRNA hydrolase [Pseudidiomarina gelatinasegens]|tara:strand:- start:733 stop:1149 length:417 start_codon:yes stop_codon:yes gene_type:complete
MVDIVISQRVTIPEREVEWQFIRSSGAGGQNVNKVSTAAQLIFDIRASSLPELYKERLLMLRDHRVTQSGKIIIKCQESRSQLSNRESALAQFVALVKSVGATRKKRIPTKPSKAAKQRRVDSKKKRSSIKAMRGKVD